MRASPKLQDELDKLEKAKALLVTGTQVETATTGITRDIDILNNFLTCKPVVDLVNLSTNDFVIDANGGFPIIPHSAQFESEFLEFTTAE